MSWLNVNEACAYLGCSRQTLYREMNRGALRPDGKVGGRRRFRVETLDEYVTSEKTSHANVSSQLGRLAGEEVANATQATTAQAHEGSRHLAPRGREIPGPHDVERCQDRETEETGADGINDAAGSRSSVRPARKGKEALARELARLRDAVGS